MPDRLPLVLLLGAMLPATQGATETVPETRVRITGAREAAAAPEGELLEGRETRSYRVDGELLTLPKPGKRLTGTLLAQDAESVTIRAAGHAQPLRIPREALASMEVSRGRGSRLTGALVGLGVGFALGFALGSSCDDSGSIIDLCGADFGLAVGAVIGLPGALIGLAVPPAERWEHVAIEGPRRVQLKLAPQRGGVGLGLSIGF